jgi:hypothetical protein
MRTAVMYQVVSVWLRGGGRGCSHNFPDRLTKGEDVFYFCFYLLPFLIGDEFSYSTLAALHHKPVPCVTIAASARDSSVQIPCVGSSVDERVDESIDPLEAVLHNQEMGLPRVDSFSSFASSQTGSPFTQSQDQTPGMSFRIDVVHFACLTC